MSLPPGEIALRRHFIHDRLARVWVTRVVSDDDRGLLLWVPEGSPWLELLTADGRTLRQISFEGWLAAEKRLDRRAWQGSTLMWHPPGAPYSVWLFYVGDCAFEKWYVNLERVGVRWAGGIDTVDWDLDVEIAPDRTWRWKDEEEFVARLPHGRDYWVDDEDEVRAAGAEVVKLVEAGEFPFDGTWTDFRPDPSWQLPSDFPAGWDGPRAW